jgi:DNA-binding response OmpR family regulator
MTIKEKATILVVDDEETMRTSLADILRLEGHRVRAVSSGEMAIEALQNDSFDLVLLDLKMPGMDGLDVMRHIPQVAPEIQVIMLTAHGSLESAIEALRLEAHDYLLKPASAAQIVNSVESALFRSTEAKKRKLLIEQLDSSVQMLKDSERKETFSHSDNQAIPIRQGFSYNYFRREIIYRRRSDDGKSKTETVVLTPTEGKLLRVLLENQGKVMSHRDLVFLVQGYNVSDWEAPEVLRPLVSRLRHKLSRLPGGDGWISNVRGTGYVLDLECE